MVVCVCRYSKLNSRGQHGGGHEYLRSCTKLLTRYCLFTRYCLVTRYCLLTPYCLVTRYCLLTRY